MLTTTLKGSASRDDNVMAKSSHENFLQSTRTCHYSPIRRIIEIWRYEDRRALPLANQR